MCSRIPPKLSKVWVMTLIYCPHVLCRTVNIYSTDDIISCFVSPCRENYVEFHLNCLHLFMRLCCAICLLHAVSTVLGTFPAVYRDLQDYNDVTEWLICERWIYLADGRTFAGLLVIQCFCVLYFELYIYQYTSNCYGRSICGQMPPQHIELIVRFFLEIFSRVLLLDHNCVCSKTRFMMEDC